MKESNLHTFLDTTNLIILGNQFTFPKVNYSFIDWLIWQLLGNVLGDGRVENWRGSHFRP
jgi:hypothetical protein